jgi:hypothetical protein
VSTYNTRIEKIESSTVAIGDNATAVGASGSRDRDDMVETLSVLLGIVGKNTGPAADEVLRLALDARREISVGKPDKEVFRRLVDATRKMMQKLGSSVIGAAELADAVAKISEVIRHL